MARKLSQIARCASVLAAAGFTFSAHHLPAQEQIHVTTPANVVENPFATPTSPAQSAPPSQPQPQPPMVLDEPQTTHRHPVTYQNPFSDMAKSPPVDVSLRPGPVSRWRHPIIPGEEKSSVKTAMLTPPPAAPSRPEWDQLPPAENLRFRALSRAADTDPNFYDRLANPPAAIQFTPKSLTQPAWLTPESAETTIELNPLSATAAAFEVPLNTAGFAEQTAALSPAPGTTRSNSVVSAFAIDSYDGPLSKTEQSPTIVADGADTPEGWLEQAQHAAADANSGRELSSVIELCRRGMRGGPSGKLSSSLNRLAAWAHNRRGEVKADAGQADDALNDFQAAIALDPDCSLAIHNRAVTLAQQNQFAAALRDFNRVIELNPGLAVAYRNRAELLAAIGRMDEAVADYNQAIESLPNNSQLYRGRAYAYQRLGSYHKALADLNHALELSPNDPDAFTQRGNLSAEQGEFERAISDFQKAISHDPSWAEAYRSLAWLEATCPNARFQSPQHAVAAAEQAAKLSPANDYLALDTLAAAYANAGEFDKAIEIEQKAMANAPPDQSPLLGERLTLYRHGRAYRNTLTSSAKRATNTESRSPSSASRLQSR